MANGIICNLRQHTPTRYVGERPVLIFRATQQVVARSVEAQPGDRCVMGTDDLLAGGIADKPDTNGGVGGGTEHDFPVWVDGILGINTELVLLW